MGIPVITTDDVNAVWESSLKGDVNVCKEIFYQDTAHHNSNLFAVPNCEAQCSTNLIDLEPSDDLSPLAQMSFRLLFFEDQEFSEAMDLVNQVKGNNSLFNILLNKSKVVSMEKYVYVYKLY